MLGRYDDPAGATREIVTRPAAAGSLLVIDRDADTLGDCRLVAHLGADEPVDNAALVCREYLRDPAGRWCRALAPEDVKPPTQEHARVDGEACVGIGDVDDSVGETELVDRWGCAYRLEAVRGGASIPQLRWRAHLCDGAPRALPIVSVRDAIASLESYEPVRSVTVRALARHGADARVSVTKLRAELERIDASRIVLNRGLREAVLAAVREQEVSMSEIALRCGRIKRDARGNRSGETSWLARRIGLLAEGGGSTVTPWIHSEVLALIARRGLGISPREVELG